MTDAPGLKPLVDAILPKNFSPATRSAVRLSAEDRLEMEALGARFNWAVDGREYGALAGLFTEDGVLDHQWGYAEGGQAIVELVGGHRPDEEYVRHQTTNIDMVLNDDGTVTKVGYLLALSMAGPEAPYIIAHGIQSFECRKEDDAWKFARVTLEQTVVNPKSGAPGQAIEFSALTAGDRAERDGWY